MLNETTFRKPIAIAFCVGFAMLSAALLLPPIYTWNLLPDYIMFWTGGRFAMNMASELYDVAAVTAAQRWFWPNDLPLPFIYPPSSLPLFVPFSLFPFWPAYWLWTAASGFAFWMAARRVVSGWAVPLTFASPHVVNVLLLGQTTLWIGAALLSGISLLRTKPFVAGLFFGFAAAVKPQAALLAPLAFASGRHWHAFAGAVAGFALFALPSLLQPSLWLDWYAALDGFDGILAKHGLFRLGATPVMAAKALNLSNTMLVQLGSFLLGAAIIWRGFRWEDLHLRVIAFGFGTLLASPYAIRYEVAMIAPVLVAAGLRGSLYGVLTALPLFALNVFAILPTILISTATAFRTAEIRSTSRPKDIDGSIAAVPNSDVR